MYTSELRAPDTDGLIVGDDEVIAMKSHSENTFDAGKDVRLPKRF
jgi:hypothetical protein